MTDPIPLASGRDADVFAAGPGRVLRRFRRDGDTTYEAAVMTHLAGYAFPVPAVYEAHGPDLVMERVDGPTMLGALIAGDLGVEEAGEMLAGLHGTLHEVPPRVGARPGDRILHLDLHPDNVILGARGPVVIDWTNATEGDPDFDLALSALILAQVAIGAEHEMAAGAQPLMASLLHHAGGDPLRMLGAAVDMRRHNPTMTPRELDELDRAADLVRAALA